MSDHKALATNHKRIWLQPLCCTDERMWCEDPQPCDECGLPAIEYMRADLIPAPIPSHGALLAEVDAAAKIIREGHGHLPPETIARQILALLPAPEGWRPIDTAPIGDDDFYLVCCADPRDDRSPFVVRGSIFASARKHPPMHHLSMAYLTHWQPLPSKPAIVADNHAGEKA